MAKAVKPLPIRSPSLNRRSLLRGGSIAAAAVAVPSVARATPQLPTPQPTALGRQYLAVLAELRAAWEAHDDTDIPSGYDGDAEASPSGLKIAAINVRKDAIEDRIETVPVLSLAAMIDRAIVAANWTDGSDNTEKSIDLIKGTLALAGLTMNDCMSAGEYVDE